MTSSSGTAKQTAMIWTGLHRGLQRVVRPFRQ
nr:MAG TPA: hypothetical protein [Caudoviricetes sp.]